MIAFQNLTKRYGRQVAVENFSLEVRAGEIVAVLGPNGSGKTTSLKAAAGLIRPSAGRVLIGEPPRPSTDPTARRALSYLPQRVSFPDSLTGREVVEFYRALRGIATPRAGEVLHFASLNGAGDRTVATYSGGMVQRLGLAVAILPDVEVLLLDEPTAALDPDGLCAFYGVAEQRKAAGRTVLFTSHQLGDAERLADRFAILVGGRLVALLSQSDLRDRLSSRGLLRLRLAALPPDVLRRVRALSPDASWYEPELVVPGPARLRPQILHVIMDAGLEIRGLTAEEGRLDTFYQELIRQENLR